MKRSTARWTTSLAAAALLGLPVSGMAQTPATAQPPAATTQQPPAAAGAQSDPAQNAAAQEHLQQAKSALASIAPTAVTGKNKTQLAELKRHLNALERAAGSNTSASTTGAAQRSTRATAAKGNVNWGTEVAAIDKILTTMIGPADAPASPTGTSGSAATGAALDEATKTQLMAVRTHVTAFAAAMSGTASDAPTPAATPDTAAAASTSSSTGSTSTTGSTSSTTGSMTGTTGTTGTTASQDPAAQPPATPQVDAEAARQRLTEARNKLSELTQLPAAAQLSGEARTQVSQLIANFNELITTQAEWRASYTKVEANLDALIGPDNTDAEPTGGVSTGTTGTTGTAGAVGTSGSTAGVANLDPAIRAKLVELRQKLNEFEKAAGGGATAGAAASTAPSAATSTSASNPGSMTQSTTPQAGTQATTEAMGHEEALRHIAAIEAILNVNGASPSTPSTTGTSGTTTPPATATAANLTLTSTQLEQLKTHLAELRRLVGEAKK